MEHHHHHPPDRLSHLLAQQSPATVGLLDYLDLDSLMSLRITNRTAYSSVTLYLARRERLYALTLNDWIFSTPHVYRHINNVLILYRIKPDFCLALDARRRGNDSLCQLHQLPDYGTRLKSIVRSFLYILHSGRVRLVSYKDHARPSLASFLLSARSKQITRTWWLIMRHQSQNLEHLVGEFSLSCDFLDLHWPRLQTVDYIDESHFFYKPRDEFVVAILHFISNAPLLHTFHIVRWCREQHIPPVPGFTNTDTGHVPHTWKCWGSKYKRVQAGTRAAH